MKTDVGEFLASYPYSEATKDAYRRVFARLLAGRDLGGLTAAGLVELVQSQGWGNSQQCLALAACRKFLCWRYGQSHAALSARIKSQRPKHQRVLTPEKALELLMWFDASKAKGARDLALAATLLDTGLRVSEVCRLQLADTDLDRRVLQVVVKGGQWGIGVFSDQTAEYISAWLALRRAKLGEGALFVSTRSGCHLTREGLQSIVKQWGRAIGIKLSPHDFRRSYATIATVFGAPSRLIQLGGRWSSIGMVERYTQSVSPEAIRPYLPVKNLTA
jgi:integrase